MPFGNAQSLSDDEVYAITAYLLYLNDLVDEDFVLSHENFADISLPNEPAFYMDDRAQTEYAVFAGEPCMANCKPSVEVTMRAAVLDVTPEETKARQLREAVNAAKQGIAPEKVAANAEEPTPELVVEATEADPAQIAAGEKAFKKCKACHQVGEKAKNRSGPIPEWCGWARCWRGRGFQILQGVDGCRRGWAGLGWHVAGLPFWPSRATF